MMYWAPIIVAVIVGITIIIGMMVDRAQKSKPISKSPASRGNQRSSVATPHSISALAPDTTDPKDINRRLSQVSKLIQSGNPQEAMTLILSVLDEDRDNVRAINLAETVLFTGEDKLSRTLYHDPFLDRFFAQCVKCGGSWVVNPMYKDISGSLTISNPVGGNCPKCGRIYCRNCAERVGAGLSCPNDHTRLLPVIEPNGRKRQIAPRSSKNKLAHAVILRHPPDVHHIAGYIQLILESSCSEALTDGSKISYQLMDKAPEQGDITAYLLIQGKIKGWPNYLGDEYEISYKTLTDEDDGKCTLVTVYYR